MKNTNGYVPWKTFLIVITVFLALIGYFSMQVSSMDGELTAYKETQNGIQTSVAIIEKDIETMKEQDKKMAQDIATIKNILIRPDTTIELY